MSSECDLVMGPGEVWARDYKIGHGRDRAKENRREQIRKRGGIWGKRFYAGTCF